VREYECGANRAGKLTSSGVLELALYHSLGKLPEPASTHDFF